MTKITRNWFKHDYFSGEDPKVALMVMDYGAIGYGLFWYFVELLHREQNHSLDRTKQYLFTFIASRFKIQPEMVKSFVTDCINKYEIFKADETKIWMDRVNQNIEEMNQPVSERLSELRAAAGKRGGLAKAAKTQPREPETAEEFFNEANDGVQDFVSNIPNGGKTHQK